MKISCKFTLGFLVIATAIMISEIISFFDSQHVKKEIDIIVQGNFNQINSATEVSTSLQKANLDIIKILFALNKGHSKDMTHVRHSLMEGLQNLQRNFNLWKKWIAIEDDLQSQLDDDDDEEEEAFHKKEDEKVNRMITSIEKNLSIFVKNTKILVNMSSKGEKDKIEDYFINEVDPYLLIIHPLIEGMLVNIKKDTVEEIGEIKSFVKNTVHLGYVRTVIAILLAICMGLLGLYTISRPLTKLCMLAQEIGKGNFGLKSSIKSNDEIGILARTFNQMAENILKTTISRDYLDDIMRSMMEMVIVLDSDRRIKIINQATTKVLGYSKDDLIDQNIELILEKSEFSMQINNGPIEQIEKIFKTKDGGKIPILFSASTIQNKNNNTEGIVCVARDITKIKKEAEEKEKLQAQLFQSAKLATVGTLSAGLAHELNNPLAAIISFSFLIEKQSEKAEYVQDRIIQLKKAAIRMKKIIDHLRKFTRESSEEDWEKLNFKEPIKDSLILLNERLHSRNITIDIDVAEDLPFIWGNHNEIESIFQNLIVNSMDSFDEINDNRKKWIKIKACEEKNGLSIIHEDNANGMTEETKNRIFDPFFTTKDIGSGTGLGMSIIYGVIEKHKGTISFDTKLGEGTKFNLFFLEDKVEMAKKNEGLINEQISSLNLVKTETLKKSILIIDDDESIVVGLKDILSIYSNFDVTTYTDSSLALEELKKTRYDLLLIDIAMPKVSGLEILSAANKYQPNTPAIIITGYNEDDKLTTRALENGAKALIQKPICNPNEFILQINNYLAN